MDLNQIELKCYNYLGWNYKVDPEFLVNGV